ncbi:MAG: hypothetical protein ACRCZP_05470, partial [Phycicoccus sp.]
MVRTTVAVLLASVLAATAVSPAVAAGPPEPRADGGERLARGLAQAVQDAGFDRLVDFETRVDGVAQPARALPNVDTAVIELDRSGRVTGAANVLYDRDSPQGYRVAVDRRSLGARGVQLSQWRLDRWDDQTAWDAGPAPGDVLVQPRRTDKAYMAAYPASLLKLMVGYGVLRLVDRGELSLRQEVRYRTVGSRSCA